MKTLPEENPAPGSNRTQTIIYFICQLFTIGSFAWLGYTQHRALESKQETIDDYEQIVIQFKQTIAFKDSLYGGSIALRDSVIDRQQGTITNYEHLMTKYEKSLDATILYLKKANKNADKLLNNYKNAEVLLNPDR